MSVISKVRITQFLPGSFESDVRDFKADTDCSLSVNDTEGAGGSDYSIKHLNAIQNPSSSSRGGYVTGDSADWSDSPDNQPDLNDRYR
ncbi:MAG: hypothetical protein KAS32_09705, partial [Candidatus Peribacteraceae bacterium]|nr:hypothetical protein [Candidatus Peribacteraceae bacterium]